MTSSLTSSRVLVCGGGMAGLTAGLGALEAGAQVVLIEKAPRVGGTTALSGGLVWTFADLAHLQSAIPYGNDVLQKMVYDSVDEDRTWLARQGVLLGPDEPLLGHGRGRIMDPPQAVAALAERFRSLGGETLTSTALDELIIRDGNVVGVTAQGERSTELPAAAVVLATGGFQGNSELLTRYVVPPDNLYLRSNPWSTGDAFLAATGIGAAATSGLENFYGHALLAPPAQFTDRQFRDASQYYGPNAVAINVKGERFADESEGTGEEVLNQRLARQSGGCGYYILDAAILGMEVMGGMIGTSVILDRARTYHPALLVSETLEGLCDALGQYGVPPAAALRTLGNYNAAVTRGRTCDLVPARTTNHFPLTHPPFYAVGVKASITFSMGGLAVDERLRVLRRAKTISLHAHQWIGWEANIDAAIPGLFAAGCDVGNLSHLGYMGGLSVALVTGRRAGREAAKLVRHQSRLTAIS